MPSVNFRFTERSQTKEMTALVLKINDNESSIKLYLNKLSLYFEVVMNMMQRKKEGSVYHLAKFKHCTQEDFEKRGVKVDRAFLNNIEGRLCPDVKDDEEFYKVLNGYTNENIRHSF